MNFESNKAKSCFVFKDNKFREYYCKKNGNVCFRCILKTYGWCFFGLSLLPSDEVGTALAKEIMSTIPADDRCRKFADYVVDYYIDSRCDFAPDLWASSPQQSPTTTNAAESFHSHLNADIKTPHPKIYMRLFNRLYVNRSLPTY